MVIKACNYDTGTTQMFMLPGRVNGDGSTIFLGIFSQEHPGMKFKVPLLWSHLIDSAILRPLVPIWLITHEEIMQKFAHGTRSHELK